MRKIKQSQLLEQVSEKLRKPGILSLLKPYSGIITLLITFAILGNGLNLLIPKLIGESIDSYNAGSFQYKLTILKFVLLASGILIFGFLQSITQTFASERVARDLRTDLADKISKQSFIFIQTTNPSRLLTNLTSDVDSIKLFVSQAIVSIVSSVFIIIGASVLLLSINWKLGLLIMAIIPIIGGAFFIVLKKVRVLFKKSREVLDWLNKVINESILGAMLIRILNSQQIEYEKFFEASHKAKSLGLSILRLFAWLIPIIVFTSNMGGLTILVLGGHYVINGRMTLGDFAAFNSYLSLLIFPILVIGFMSNVIAQATTSYERVTEMLKKPELPETGGLKSILTGEITVENVSLSYQEKCVLNNINISIKPGSRTAIIGPTAAGKSQLLYLISGLLQPDTGVVKFNGHLIAAFHSQSFYKQIGLVFQDSVLFNMSIRENITFSDVVTEEALNRAIETAELRDFIDSLPEGLNTNVSERGLSLSGGQKQRIMLARALSIDPKIILLDDFTARVDYQTELRILFNIQKNYPLMTLISVTQKIEPIVGYEQIILMMQGEILAVGVHDDLINTSPEYVQIFNSQQSTSDYEL
jgi:ATP-binding cassette subfamily B protein